MKQIKILLAILSFGGLALRSQTPTLSITPSGTMSVCAGSSVVTTATLSNAFAGTTSYSVSDIPFAPYSALGGTNLVMPDDTVLGVFPIGFQFCFYGNAYTQFYCGSNGWVGFSLGQPRAFTANSIPNAGALVPKNCIMGPWMDFNPGISGGPYVKYQTQGVAPFRRLVVQWTNVPSYLCTSLKNTFQIILFESTNNIETHITSKTVCGGWAGGTATQGLHNQSGTAATVVPGRNAAVWNATNDAKRFTPNGPPGYTVNWTINGFPSGTGITKTTLVSGPGMSRIIAKVTFQCSNLILYDTLDVSIGGAASAAFTYTGGNASNPLLICAGQPATFTYVGGAAGTGNWSFPGSTTPALGVLGPVTATWMVPGTYSVTLNVAPSSGACSPGTSTQIITVTAPPTSTFSSPAPLCVGSNGTFTFTGVSPPGSTLTWNFGLGAIPLTSTGVGPHTVSWATSGTKTASLTVSSGTCSSTSSNTITVNAAPTSNFTALPATICALSNGTVTFTGAAAAGATFNWNFGANATPATANTVGPHSVNWSVAGSKTISLTVTSSGCSSTFTNLVNVNAIPSASFSLPASVCIGANASVLYTGIAPVPPAATYTWAIGGGTPAPGNVQGPFNLSWATSGAKTVGLTVTQGGCSSVMNSQSITVNALPTVSILPTPATVCIGQATSFTTTVVQPAGTTYNWSFGALASPLTSTTAGPVAVSWSTAGAKTASLTVTSNGCSSLPATAAITVSAAPSATISLPANACQGAGVVITAAGPFAGGTTFNWNFGTGTVISGSGAGPYSVSWATTGSKTVSLTTTAGGCSSSSSSTILIQSGPVAGISLPANSCTGQSTSVSFNGTANGTTSYLWNFGVGAIPATASTSGPHNVSWSSSGSKTITLTVNDGGCSSSTSATITINPIYLSTFTAPATICQGTAGIVNYTGNAPIGATYAWGFGTGSNPTVNATQGPHSVTWNTPGNQTVSLAVTMAGCTSPTTSQSVTVTAAPVVAFTASSPIGVGLPSTLTFTGSALAGATYNWNFDVGSTPSSATGLGPHSVTWSSSGSKTATLSVTQNGCTSSSSQVITVVNVATATFTSPISVCEGGTATITYTGNALASATYAWGFNGGTIVSGSGAGPYTISWNTAGTKTITLAVTQNGITSAVNSAPITVNPIPSSAFNLPISACVGSPTIINYTGSSTSAANYSWTFGGNASQSTAITQGPQTISWPSSGTFTVNLRLTENGCTSLFTTHSINVLALPSASFSLPVSSCVNASTLISYSGAASPAATYLWNFGTNATPATALTQGPNLVSWSTSGNKSVSLTVTESGCTSIPVSHTILVNSLPSAAFALSSPYCVNEPATISYTGGATAGAAYSWTYPGAILVSGAGAGPIQLSWSTGGTKTVNLSVTENGCTSTTVSQTTVINSLPVFTVSSPGYSGINTPATITYNGVQASGASYSWNFNGGIVNSGSGAGPYEVTWAGTGIKNISCTVAITGCPPVTQSTTTEIMAGATVSMTAQSPVCVNAGSSIVYTGVSVSSASYLWDFSGGTILSGSGAGPYQISWSGSGMKTISLAVTQFGITTSTRQTVAVNAIPTSTFSIPAYACSAQNALISYTGNGGAGSLFNWNFGSGVITNGTGEAINEVTFQNSGTFPISLSVVENGCSSSVTTLSVTVRRTPSAAFSLAASVCEGLTAAAQLLSNPSAGATFDWNFGTSQYIDGSGPGPINLQFDSTGICTSSLVITENQCMSDTFFIQTSVQPRPVAHFNIQATACSNDTAVVTFTGTAVITSSFNWDFGTSAVLSGSASGPYELTFPSSGVYPISLSVNNNGCISQTETQQITLNATPVNSFILTDTTYVSIPATAIFAGIAPFGTSFTWNYPSADRISGSGPGPLALKWNLPGTYDVTLSLNNNGCIPSPVIHQIVVLPFPSSTFSVSQDTVCELSTVDFIYTGLPVSGASYNWNFDGGTIHSGNGSGPYSISWSAPGWKSISLQLLINGVSSITSTFQVLVIEVPGAEFSVQTEACIGENVLANYLNSANVSAQFQWTLDGATGISGVNSGTPNFSWNTPGSKTITLSVANAMCISSVVIHSIQVHGFPTSSFSVPSFACKNAAIDISYTGAQIPGAVYSWDFSGAIQQSGNNQGPYQISWATSGSKHVRLTVTANGCTSVVTDSIITVRELPVPNAGADKLLCSGDTIQLEGNEFAGFSYKWLPSGGMNSDTISNPILSLQTTHSYVDTVAYQFIVNDGFCDAGDEVLVFIAPKPESGFDVPPPQCFNNNSFNFQAGGSYDESASFSWDLGPHANAHSPNEQNQTGVQFDTPGYQVIRLRISQFGCESAVFTDSVLINTHPTVNYTAQNRKGCVPLTTTFSGLSTAIQNAIYTWNFGDGNSGTGIDVEHTYLQSGFRNVVLTILDSNGCTGNFQIQNYIQVLEPPVAGFIPTPELLFIGEDELELISTSRNALYSYYVIQGDTILGSTNTYSFKDEGVYPITQVVINGAGCSDQITHVVRVQYGSSYYFPSAFTPNSDGNNDEFRISASDIYEFRLVIYDRWGHEVFSTTDIEEGWDGTTVEGNHPMPEGVYVFKLELRTVQNREVVENGQFTLLR
jgi:gliding motility-associated-like protein